MLFGQTVRPRRMETAGQTPGIGDDIEARRKGLLLETVLDAPAPRDAPIPASPAPAMSGGMFGRKNTNGGKLLADALGMPAPAPAGMPALNAVEGQPGHWTVDGFDKMRSQQQPMSSDHGMLPQGPLGSSMRQPFDYDAAYAQLVGEKPKIKDWQKVLAVVADGLVAAGGGQGHATEAILGRQQAYRERQQKALATVMGWRHGDWQNQNEADLRASAPFSSGRDRVQYDPTTGQSHVIYDGPEDFETYAQELGLEPGSEDYFKAVEDYVLKGNGPSAYDRDVGLAGTRFKYAKDLEAVRQANRIGLEGQRQQHREGMVDYRNAHPAPARLRSAGSPRQTVVSVKTPAEASRLAPGTHYRGPDGVVRER